MADLNFDDLRLFSRVATLGTLSAVARERHAPVSQISRGLQRIETAYGTQLVLRTTHGLSLTPEGQILQAYALRILDEVDALDAEFGQARDSVSGLVRISMSAIIAQHLLINSLPSLSQRHPHLRIDFRVDDALVDMARDGIDIAIRSGEPQSDTFVVRRIGQLQRHLYASPTYLAARGTPASLDDLQAHDLIANSQHMHLNAWAFKNGSTLHAHGRFSADDTATVASMAITGLGIARITSVVADPLVAQGKLVKVLPEELDVAPIPLSAFMLAGRHRLPKIRACLDHWTQWLQTTSSTC